MSYWFSEWCKLKEQLSEMESQGRQDAASKIRNIMISYWNRLSPTEQKELAERFITERTL